MNRVIIGNGFFDPDVFPNDGYGNSRCKYIMICQQI